MGAIIAVIVMGYAPEHATVTGAVTVVVGTLRHNVKHTTKKNIHYNNFIWLQVESNR